VSVTEYDPGVLGVPLITPVAVSSDNPAGREDEDHVNGPVPPELAGAGVDNALPPSTVYVADVEESEGTTSTVIVTPWLACSESESVAVRVTE
jgi:hypothetical protein